VADQTYVKSGDLRTAADNLKGLITDDIVKAFQTLVDAPMLTGQRAARCGPPLRPPFPAL
jgi:hypothetical protein